ncbi:MAG: NAD(P)/FAD-dependent oxidoreductase [Wenzhouxiangella sp.]|nr:MAG: NAD(P)/FAD-dependent oxidoreductase [Wenzhouxiangella sp.]
MPHAPAPVLSVLIIGAGFSGIGLAIRLQQAGIGDFRILEAASGIGGTWWVNRYPGCACDVQSHLYSLSFEPRADWSRQFAGRAEIQRYLADCVDRHELADRIVLNSRVEQARWQEGESVWQVRDHHGVTYRARVLVSAIGGLSRPAWPDIPGLDRFAGPVVHSQTWPESLDVEGKRVAVIGTGASAIQFVPHLQTRAARLDLYQRSAQWILPKPDRAIARWRQAMYRRFPPARWLTRLGLFVLLETRLPAFTRFPRLTALHRRKARRHLERQVSDPTLRARLMPDYAMGCKRVLMSNDYYPAVAAANVELVAGGVERVEGDTLVDHDGRRRKADLIVLGTGFRAADPVPEGMILGRDGRDLAHCWSDGPRAYKGCTVPGFPNFFTLLGPNTALGHNSVILMIEGQIRYLVSALRWMQRHKIGCLEVHPAFEDRWNDRLQRRLKRTVWNTGGCSSWYRHPVSGRIPTLWPRFTFTFRWLLRRFDPAAYRIVKK